MQRKYLIIGGVVIVLLLASIGGYFVLGNKGGTTDITQEEEGIKQQEVKKLTVEDIGLELSLRGDKKVVNMVIGKLDGIKSFEYEATFDAEVVDPESKDLLVVPRGSGGSIDVESTDTQIKREITLGTCSSGKCKYDKVVSDVKFLIRVNYSNGEIGSVEDTISL